MQRTITTALLAILVAGTAAAAQRPYTSSGSFALYLDGTFAGYVNKMSGGFAEAKVVELLPPDDYYVKKLVDWPPSYKQITLVVGGGMTTAFYDWVRESLNGNFTWKDGAVVATDHTGKPIRTLDFYDAQITQVAFPRFDAESKETFYFTVQITPSSAFMSRGGTTPPAPTAQKSAKRWVVSNFDLVIDGLSNLRTSAVEAIVIDIPLGYPPGTICIPPYCPPPLAINFPNIEVTLAATGSEPVVEWYEDFVYNASNREKNGTLRLLSPTLRDTILILELHNLGPISTERVERDGLPAAVALRMYSEFIRLQVTPGS